jgi:colicin import membrane protein
MKGIVQALLVVGALAQVHAQPAESGANPDITVQQQRLDTQRQQAAQQAHDDERACQERFAVNDCLKAARARNLEKTADIRRQQERLNDLQRKQRGEEKIRQHEEKSAQHEQVLRDAEHKTSRVTDAKGDAKNGHASTVAIQRAAVHTQPTAPVGRQEYQRKLQDAEKRRQERDKRLSKKASGKSPAPLPAAP